MSPKPSPRIAIKPDLYEAIRLRAAKEGMWPHELVSMWLRERLDTEPHGQIATNPTARELPLQLKAEPPRTEAEKRAWHGGPPPLEESNPELAARILAMWAGGKRKGGMSRDEVARKLRKEGIEITAGTVDKLTIRARKKAI